MERLPLASVFIAFFFRFFSSPFRGEVVVRKVEGRLWRYAIPFSPWGSRWWAPREGEGEGVGGERPREARGDAAVTGVTSSAFQVPCVGLLFPWAEGSFSPRRPSSPPNEGEGEAGPFLPQFV